RRTSGRAPRAPRPAASTSRQHPQRLSYVVIVPAAWNRTAGADRHLELPRNGQYTDQYLRLKRRYLHLDLECFLPGGPQPSDRNVDESTKVNRVNPRRPRVTPSEGSSSLALLIALLVGTAVLSILIPHLAGPAAAGLNSLVAPAGESNRTWLLALLPI